MICESCKQREATVVLTHIVEDGKSILSLCGACAGTDSAPETSEPPPGKKVVAEMDQMPAAEGAAEGASESAVAATCAACGLTYEAFKKAGRFGCPSCYESFGPPLERLLKRIHGSLQHVGKGTVDPEATSLPAEELGQLRQELEAAVAEEAFERAAQIRDRIIQLEQQSGPDAPKTE